MNTLKSLCEMSDNITAIPLDVTNQKIINYFSLPIGLAIAASIGLGFSAPVLATEDIQHYRDTKPQVVENTTNKAGQTGPGASGTTGMSKSVGQNSPIDRQAGSVSKPADGKGALPTFAQADSNGDHVVTKVELKNFPYLLQVFDKVDAGGDGKLEQHEYQNLEMETKREGEIS